MTSAWIANSARWFRATPEVKSVGVTIQGNLWWDSQVDHMLTSGSFLLCVAWRNSVSETQNWFPFTQAMCTWCWSMQSLSGRVLWLQTRITDWKALRNGLVKLYLTKGTQGTQDLGFARKLLKSNFSDYHHSGRSTQVVREGLTIQIYRTKRYRRSPIPYMFCFAMAPFIVFSLLCLLPHSVFMNMEHQKRNIYLQYIVINKKKALIVTSGLLVMFSHSDIVKMPLIRWHCVLHFVMLIMLTH